MIELGKVSEETKGFPILEVEQASTEPGPESA